MESPTTAATALPTMQLLATDSHYYIKSVRRILRCSRASKDFSVVHHSDLANLEDVQILGDVYGLFGKIHCEDHDYRVVVVDCSEVASIRSQPVYRI